MSPQADRLRRFNVQGVLEADAQLATSRRAEALEMRRVAAEGRQLRHSRSADALDHRRAKIAQLEAVVSPLHMRHVRQRELQRKAEAAAAVRERARELERLRLDVLRDEQERRQRSHDRVYAGRFASAAGAGPLLLEQAVDAE